MQSNPGVGPSSDYATAWTTVPGSDYDILDNDPRKNFNENGRVCRGIRVGTAGTLVVTRPDGTDVTIDFGDKEFLPIQAKTLKVTGSTAQQVVVMW